jgi:hypothetical protein
MTGIKLSHLPLIHQAISVLEYATFVAKVRFSGRFVR